MELQNSHDTVGGKQEPLTSTINQANVLEWAVWQVRTEASYVEVKSFNNTIGTIVQGIGSPFMQVSDRSWVINTTFFEEKEYATFGNTSQDVQRKIEGRGKDTIEVAAAIGVRCVVRSVLGSAMIHEETSSFSDFKIEEPTPYGKVNAEGPMSRLGTNVEAVIQTSQAADINRPNYQSTNQVGVEMTSPTNQESSRLFELPWEIRERIYEYYLSFDHDDFGDTLRPLHLYIEQGGYSKPIPPLMLTSKRAYRELHQRVHSDAVMRVHTAGWGDRRIGFAVHGKLRFERLRRLNVALIARREEQLRIEKKAVEEAAPSATVKTYTADITDPDAFTKVLDQADADLGKPSCVFFNAARVQMSEMLVHDVKEMEYDFKINVSALYAVAQRYIPHLIELAKSSPESTPALIITSSVLPYNPHPAFFALSLVKAAQRNLAQTLRMSYESEGVHIGLINVGGQVFPDHETWNPPNIAEKAWEWFSQIKENPSFEVKI
ncbi:hypothetical protein CGCF413_v010917 [Colletotrichum fructicola]|nr:hypothetical protein CGCF413_v010917 [Colletotrichum fructicola]